MLSMDQPVVELSRVIFVIELIGVVAFAISGALTAIEREMDIFGVLVLALITALGGGIIRDILVNRFPVSLSSPLNFYVAIIGMLIAIPTIRFAPRYLPWLKIFDALGLAVFSILGAQVGIQQHLNFLSIMLLGLLTGIGGGVVRDILANEVPLVLRQEVYALASLLGITVFWWLDHTNLPSSVTVVAGAITVLGIRLAAIRWNLNLPHIRHR